MKPIIQNMKLKLPNKPKSIFFCFTRVVQFLVDELLYLCVSALSEYLVSPCKRWSWRSLGYFLMGKRYQEKNWSDCCGFLHLSPKIGQSLWAFCKTLPGKGKKLSRDFRFGFLEVHMGLFGCLEFDTPVKDRDIPASSENVVILAKTGKCQIG